MSQNRYTPPGADLRTGGDDTSLGTGDFDFGICLAEAWSKTWSNFLLWLGVSFVWLLALGVATFTVVGIFLVVPVLFWGMFRFYLAMYDGDATFGDVFSGFSRYGNALWNMLVFFVVTVVVGIPGQIIAGVGQNADSLALQLIGILVNLGVTLLVSLRLWFAPMLIVDRDMNAVDALRYSWDVTDRVKWKLIGIFILSILLPVLGVLALLVGVIPATVMAYLLIVSAYRQVVGGPISHRG